MERFWSKVNKNSECWIYSGTIVDSGYGHFTIGKKSIRAHRFSYELHKGPIPKGLVLDHLCRNKLCVNPDHLEAVTIRINTLRGHGPSSMNAKKTHCKNGHEFTEDNVYQPPGRLHRMCIICRKNKKRSQ